MFACLLAVIFLAFVSLGLPDSLLGAGWPAMHTYFGVDSSAAGYVSMTVCAMTIISSLLSERISRKLETKWVVVISIALTIVGILGFSFSTAYWMLFIFAIPYGLGAGSIDAALNNYVAIHYSSRVMSFLHCFYGVGAVISPNIMSAALKVAHWNQGYQWTAYIQIGILAVCLISLPLWKINEKKDDETKENGQHVGVLKAIRIPGVIFAMIAFFAYCSGEATCFLWTSTFFKSTKEGISDDLAASLGSLIFGGLMVGRFISGLVSNKLGDRRMIRIGIAVELIGIILIAIPVNTMWLAFAGFLLIGIGMGPIYPSIQHMAPVNFGKENSPAIIGLQMASAYVGTTFMPTVFGLLGQNVSMWIMPAFLAVFMVLNFSCIEIANKIVDKTKVN